LIGIGGFAGANLRYLVQGWAAERWGSSFPLGTLIANVTGSFILAFFITLATQRFAIAPEWRLLFAVGFVGGYTTFSSFAVETLALAQTSSWLWSAINITANMVLGLGSAFLGVILARLI
jgi:CrcB protein